MNRSSFSKIKQTGLGAVNVPFLGRKIIFEDGNYPTDSVEYIYLQNKELRARNRFLEDTMHRACEEVNYDEYDIRNYVYC